MTTDEVFKILEAEYGLQIVKYTHNLHGRDTHLIVIDKNKQKFFIKFLNNKNHNISNAEVLFVNSLVAKGFSHLPIYIPRKNGEFYFSVDNSQKLLVMKFVDGVAKNKYSFNKKLLFQAIQFIANVHINCINIKTPTRDSIIQINDIHNKRKKIFRYFNIINSTKLNRRIKFQLLKDLQLRLLILEQQHNFCIDLSKLTFINGHGDLSATQFIINRNNFTLIDWSEIAYVPVIYEIVRLYIFSAKECRKRRLDTQVFNKYLSIYTNILKLNSYDIQLLWKFNLFYYTQALSCYEKYCKTFENKYFRRIISRNKTLQILLNLC